VYIEINTEFACKSGTGRGDQGRRKRRKERVNINEIHHICVGRKHAENLNNTR
jgi:hypothetical protein